MPDTAMVFFLTAALFVTARYLTGTERLSPRELAYAAGLLTLAYLAKPVAVLALVPVAALIVARYLARRPTPVWQISTLLALPLLVLWLYDRRVASYAEWHWASGITQLHVLPALRAAFTGPAAFLAKLQQLRIVFGMLRATMLGPLGFLLSIAAFIALPWAGARSKALLWGWLAGALAYAYVVVTVERVDYYLYPFLPLCALAIAGALGRAAAAVWAADVAPTARFALLALIPALAAAVLAQSPAAVAAYYAYNPKAYQNAVTLDRALPPGALVVIGHYGPDIQYYIDRFGWEEDPLSLDAVRRRERHCQGRPLLYLDRRRPLAPQSRAMRVARALPGHRRTRPLARLPNGPVAHRAQRRILLARLSPGRTRRSGTRLPRFARRLRDARERGIERYNALRLSRRLRNASGCTAMLPR